MRLANQIALYEFKKRCSFLCVFISNIFKFNTALTSCRAPQRPRRKPRRAPREFQRAPASFKKLMVWESSGEPQRAPRGFTQGVLFEFDHSSGPTRLFFMWVLHIFDVDPLGTTTGSGTFIFEAFCLRQGQAWTSHEKYFSNSYSLIFNIFQSLRAQSRWLCFCGGFLTWAKCPTADDPAGKQKEFLCSSIPREPWLMVHCGLQNCFSINFGQFNCLHGVFFVSKTIVFFFHKLFLMFRGIMLAELVIMVALAA